MTVTAAWTDPVTLDRAVGATYPLASYELLLGDVLWLFDVLTDVIATSLKFGSTLEVVGAVTLDSTLAVTGATTVAGLHATGTVTADGGDYGSGGGAATHPNGLTSTTGAFTGAVTANAGDYGSGGGAATHPAGLTATTGSFSGAVTANGNTTRSVTYGTNIANNPSMATGTYWDAT
ncbi:MAG TPA: hypothetical protein VIU62_10320, partial [Chloroflexota bacterium]